MNYVDGFVVPVPIKNLAAYRRMSKLMGKVWREHGALEYRECVGDDLEAKGMVAFPRLAKSKPGEVVIFAYAVFESRKQRDAVNKKIMTDPRIETICGATSGIVDFGDDGTIVPDAAPRAADHDVSRAPR